MRDGQKVEIGSKELLVGDAMQFETGDILAADGLLFQGSRVRWIYEKL